MRGDRAGPTMTTTSRKFESHKRSKMDTNCANIARKTERQPYVEASAVFSSFITVF